MYSIQRILLLQRIHTAVDEVVFFDPKEGDLGTVLLTQAEWNALGRPQTITTKIEPGDTRVAQGSFRVDL